MKDGNTTTIGTIEVSTSGEGLLMSLKQLGEFLGISMESAKWILKHNMDFPVTRIGGRNYFLREAVMDWLGKKQTTRGNLKLANQNRKKEAVR